MINKFLLLDDKFIVKMHLRQLKHTYRACELFSKNKEQIEKMKKNPGISRYIYRNELHEAWFQQDMIFGIYKDLTRKTVSDELLRNEGV